MKNNYINTSIYSSPDKGRLGGVSAFTLIELVVGITISMLLMVSVGIFVSSGMQNIFNAQKVLKNTNDFVYFSNNLHSSFDLVQSGSFTPKSTPSGIIIKRGIEYGEGGFSYIGTQNMDKIYCQSGSENTSTNHIFIKNFIPFEEQGENIFSDYEEILTGNNGNYTSYQKEHIIKDSGGNIVVGKGLFGEKFIDGNNGTGVYLNSPTGLTSSGNILFISDTLNNRILYYNTLSNKIYKLLDESDGLNEPTGLYYNTSENSLYISNSGNGEILKYSSKKHNTSPDLTIGDGTASIGNVSKVKIEFLGASQNVGLSSYNKSNMDFITASSTTDFLTGSINKLDYYFVNYTSTESVQPSCSGTEIDLISDKPVKCVSSGTGQTSIYQNKNISQIDIQNIINTSNNGTYIVKVKLLNSSNSILYQNYYNYFTQGDDNILTPNDNTLEIVHSGLNYPTGIWGNGTTDYNEFGKSGRIYSDIPYHSTDNLLSTPIKSLNIINNTNNLIIFTLDYYRRYSCYNLDDNNEKTFIIMKNLK